MEENLKAFIKLKNVGFHVPKVTKSSTHAFGQIVKEFTKGDRTAAMWLKLTEVRNKAVLSL